MIAKDLEDKINQVLDEIRPALQRDGGDVKLVKYDVDSQTVELSLSGACANCPAADATLNMLLGRELQSRIPEIKGVKAKSI